MKTGNAKNKYNKAIAILAMLNGQTHIFDTLTAQSKIISFYIIAYGIYFYIWMQKKHHTKINAHTYIWTIGKPQMYYIKMSLFQRAWAN